MAARLAEKCDCPINPSALAEMYRHLSIDYIARKTPGPPAPETPAPDSGLAARVEWLEKRVARLEAAAGTDAVLNPLPLYPPPWGPPGGRVEPGPSPAPTE